MRFYDILWLCMCLQLCGRKEGRKSLINVVLQQHSSTVAQQWAAVLQERQIKTSSDQQFNGHFFKTVVNIYKAHPVRLFIICIR